MVCSPIHLAQFFKTIYVPLSKLPILTRLTQEHVNFNVLESGSAKCSVLTTFVEPEGTGRCFGLINWVWSGLLTACYHVECEEAKIVKRQNRLVFQQSLVTEQETQELTQSDGELAVSRKRRGTTSTLDNLIRVSMIGPPLEEWDATHALRIWEASGNTY